MDLLSLSEIKKLAQYMAPNSVSLYIPTPEIGAQGHMQPAHLHNALRAGLEQMQLSTLYEKERFDTIFKEIANDTDFRVQRYPALAVFIGSDTYWWYQLFALVKDFVVVSNHFHIKPLLQMVTQQNEFYLLSLNKDDVKLYKGNQDSLLEITVPNLPKNVEAVVGVEADERQLQFHTSTKGSGAGKRAAQFHGPSWKDDKQTYTDHFLSTVNDAVNAYLQQLKLKAPLLLTGVERMITDYKAVNTYENLITELFLEGNYSRDSVTQLHERVINLLTPYVIKQTIAEIVEIIDRGSTDKFSTDVTEILKQARMGRVATLLLAENAHKWGNFDPNTLEVHEDLNPTGNNSDLYDLACSEVLFTDGTVHVVPEALMPNDLSIVAVYRY